MAAVPKLELEVFQASLEVNGEYVAMGQVDITWSVCKNRGLVKRWLDGEKPRVIDIAPGIPDAVREAGYAGRLFIPGFKKSLAVFIDEVGGLKRLPELSKAMDKVYSATRWRDEAAEELIKVTDATWSTDFNAFKMFYSPHARQEDFLSNPEDLLDDWKSDEYQDENPRPSTAYNSTEYKAWETAYIAYVESDGPPFVFGTQSHKWSISAQDIRNMVNDEPDKAPMIWSFIEDSLQEHYEDAIEDVKDIEDGIQEIINYWFPHAGSGNTQDLALEGNIDTWNSNQSIVSYHVDDKITIPTFKGATQRDAVAWCERNLFDLDEKLKNALDSWVAQDIAVEPALAPARSF